MIVLIQKVVFKCEVKTGGEKKGISSGREGGKELRISKVKIGISFLRPRSSARVVR